MARNALRAIIFAAILLLFSTFVVGGFLFIVSGGDVINFVQLTMLRIALDARADDLAASVGVDDTPVRFTVNQGDNTTVIAQNLFDEGLIIDDELFVNYARVEGLDRQLEAGVYFLNGTQTIPQIALLLTDSRSSRIDFTILEGMRIEEIADQIDQSRLFGFTGADFLAVVAAGADIPAEFAGIVGLPPGVSLEGFLFPDSYQLPPDITPVELRDQLLETFLQRTGEQLRRDVSEQGYTLRDIVNIAAIVEREAVWNDEHPLIASVYRNRLDIGMRLQADPTVQYGLNGARGRWWPNITQADYQNVNSPYNTYRNDGLPPGPIASPGISAIRAAAYPAESSYFYFRAKCDRSNYHNFATTYEEHLANGC